MRVLVTRPAAQAIEWTHRLCSHGIDAVALPLIGIEPAADAQPLQAAWQSIEQQRLLVFVSPNAVEHFFARRPSNAIWPAGTFAASPGPGTTRSLVALGVAAAQIIEPAADALQFDSESLWAALGTHDWRGARALIVRGDGGRDWLAEMLRGRGALVTNVATYRRVAPTFDPTHDATLRAALGEPAGHLWFFSSSEAIDNLMQSAAAATWKSANSMATHPKIAERARQAGFARVAEARPSFDDVVACIQSFRP
jgi:uroporphyrinogen-III synthase